MEKKNVYDWLVEIQFDTEVFGEIWAGCEHFVPAFDGRKAYLDVEENVVYIPVLAFCTNEHYRYSQCHGRLDCYAIFEPGQKIDPQAVVMVEDIIDSFGGYIKSPAGGIPECDECCQELMGL